MSSSPVGIITHSWQCKPHSGIGDLGIVLFGIQTGVVLLTEQHPFDVALNWKPSDDDLTKLLNTVVDMMEKSLKELIVIFTIRANNNMQTSYYYSLLLRNAVHDLHSKEGIGRGTEGELLLGHVRHVSHGVPDQLLVDIPRDVR